MLWRVVRRSLAIFIRVFVWHPVVSLVVVVLALGAIGWSMGGLNNAQALNPRAVTGAASSPASSPSGPVTVESNNANVAPAPAVDEYIKGMTTFDAKLMWDALDPQAIQAMTSQGGSEDALQQRLNDAKQNGAHYQDVTFIGGYPLKNGDRYLFYVVTRQGFAGPGVSDQVFFVFTVGQTGKIVKIE
jgi:hypothetical protein